VLYPSALFNFSTTKKGVGVLPRYENKVNEIQGMLSSLLEKIIIANQLTLDAYIQHQGEKFDLIASQLKTIESDANMIDNEIIKTFALFGPEANELRTLISYLKMTNELVRIGEGVKKYARRMKEHCESECNLKPLDNVILQLHKSTINALQYLLDCFTHFNTCNIEDYYRKVMVEESKNDDLFAILEKEIMNLIIGEAELSIEYVKVLGTLRKLERSCDRSVNIANLMLYAKQGGTIQVY
jgi:phosphate transport system protein